MSSGALSPGSNGVYIDVQRRGSLATHGNLLIAAVEPADE